jgi:RNA polymerase sigma factor (sigma-70 family)
VGQDETTLATFAANRSALVNYAARIVGSRATAEDVVQEAWLRLGGITAARPVEHPLRYIYRVVRNVAIDLQRRSNFERRLFPAGQDSETLAEAAPSPEDETLHRQELAIVLQALSELPARTRTAVELHRFHGRKLKEIAEHLGISVALAHSLVHDGLDHCRTRLRRGR